ncbi:phage tail tube protein [Nocardioides massiliensis]|uniref:Phage tail protein n=1 Tax=Nocardioides massiliensis TaxID=1325935 RepID=A0ABT9NJI6_9ACTN|nr:hypothetical protein [Nocardioides massiliensis]MDP9820382.1 hypothetical protein [Nocardioides massiliensis]
MRSLADGHEKIAILTTKPEDPSSPTVTELAAGIQAAKGILAEDWAFGAVDSETFAERAVGEKNNSPTYGAGNYEFGATIFREFDETGDPDPTLDALFAALKVKLTTVWVYSRLTGKDSDDPWEAGDEIRLGARIETDTPRRPGPTGGYIKMRVPAQVKEAWDFITVAPAAGP